MFAQISTTHQEVSFGLRTTTTMANKTHFKKVIATVTKFALQTQPIAQTL